MKHEFKVNKSRYSNVLNKKWIEVDYINQNLVNELNYINVTV